MSLTEEEIERIRHYKENVKNKIVKEWLKKTATILVTAPLDFLDSRQIIILEKRTWKTGKRCSLEEIAGKFNITRERIRQLEINALKKIEKKYRQNLHIVYTHLQRQIALAGWVTNLDELGVELNDLSPVEQIIVSSLLTQMNKNVYIDWAHNLISFRKKELLEKIYEEISGLIKEMDCFGKSFSMNKLREATETVCMDRGIFQNSNFNNLISAFRKEKNISEFEGHLFFGNVHKLDKIGLVFKKIFPQGLHIYKKHVLLLARFREYENELIGTSTSRSVLIRLSKHPEIFLWGRGFYIHKDCLQIDNYIIKKVADWVLQYFDKGYPKIQSERPFKQFKTDLVKSGVPNPYALYTLLRQLKKKRIGMRKYPSIVDLDGDIEITEGIQEEVESYLLQQKRAVSYIEIKKEFIIQRGWKDYNLMQVLACHSDIILPWQNQSYIHIEYVSINEQKLQELIDSIRNKLIKTGYACSLKGIKKEFNMLWEQVCPDATIRTIIKLIRLTDPDDLQIDHLLCITIPQQIMYLQLLTLNLFFLKRKLS